MLAGTNCLYSLYSIETPTRPAQRAGMTKDMDNAMRGFLILLWIFWVNMAFVFGVTTVYFVRIINWRGLITAPIFALVLFAGWRLIGRSRREWNVVN